jgi:hypothetical protein
MLRTALTAWVEACDAFRRWLNHPWGLVAYLLLLLAVAVVGGIAASR